MNLINEGKVKSVYDVDPQKVKIKFHDKVTAWNGRHESFLKIRELHVV